MRSIPVFDWGKEDFNFNCDVNINGEIYQNGEPFSGGTKDYTTLDNKPSINGVQLVGDKTLSDLDIGIEDIKGKKLLWENPNPTSNFAAQTVSLTDNSENYNAFILQYLNQASNGTYLTAMIFADVTQSLLATLQSGTEYNRTINISGQQAVFGSGYAGTTANNGCILPQKLYGINFNGAGARTEEGASGIVKLWENTGTADISTATYTLSDTADFYIIHSKYYKGSQWNNTSVYTTAIDGARVSAMVAGSDGKYIETRTYTISGTTFTVGTGYEFRNGSSTEVPAYCYPVEVYGVYVRQTTVKNYSYTYNLPNINDSNLVDLVYPVGAIYISVSPANPSTLFGGTWERIQDTFLLAAGSTYAAGSTGGEAEHTLTEAEMPAHNHNYYGFFINTAVQGSGRALALDNQRQWTQSNNAIQSKGSGQAHNNMPPYLAVYMWQRTA